MAADHAERRARRVEQDAIERHAVPPRGGLAASPLTSSARSRRASDSRARAPAAADRCRPPTRLAKIRLALRDQRGLAAGRRAGIEHPLARRPSARGKATHCAPSPAPTPPLGEARQLVHVARRIERHRLRHARLRRARRCPPPQAVEISSVVASRLLTRNHIGAWASPAASSCVQRTGQSARSRSASQTGEAWRVAGLRAISASRPCARADSGAARVDEPAARSGVGGLRGLHGGIDHGILRRARILEFEQRHRQQRAHQKSSERTGCDSTRQDGLVTIIAAHRAVTQGAHRRCELRGRRRPAHPARPHRASRPRAESAPPRAPPGARAGGGGCS
jgi:hypothetical protein